MGAKLLLVGDIHLGRRPTRLPADLEVRHGLTVSELGPAAAWRAAVDLALRNEVDGVVLAGDVVEADNARFEAFGPLQEGVARLVRAGIDVIAVAGNHDVEALPRLVGLIPDVCLLGRDGRWERVTVERDGEPVAHLVGWSFPTRVHTASPLASAPFPEAPNDGLPYLGLLHADLDATGSRYAPTTRTGLSGAEVDAWFLGHVHKPSDLSGPRPIGYLGSLVGLHPGESGPHGPWLLTYDGGTPAIEQVSLAPLRWERVPVAVDRLASVHDLDGAVADAIARLDETLIRVEGAPRVVGCRIELTGATSIHRELGAALTEASWESLEDLRDGVLYFVEKVIDRSRAKLDLEGLAEQDHPPALLARRLLALERDEPEAATMIREARRDLDAVLHDRRWSGIPGPELGDEQVRELLLEQGRVALERLLEQGVEGAGAETPS